MRSLVLGFCLLLTGCIVPVGTTGQVGVPIPVFIDTSEQSRADSVYVCTLKPFTQEYRSEHTNRGIAKLNVQKKCQANHNSMFCEEKEIVCKTYD
ncbi:hypothetical protein PTQ27_07215 [Mannheimia sp. AT1]|uniref:Lipoprotein n=1 Tax=Mannheimia cairinae TaxID=3025936 RepID=A0ABT5MPZ0_9PAST|nr:hypothetical protein [Mannheimia cairinae]MDD0824249.1 hypothetical protein [Mannheimia cairinae]MDD0826628.1 hypothetical protein [Mannheimia cairinae]